MPNEGQSVEAVRMAPHRPPYYFPVRVNGEWVAAIRDDDVADLLAAAIELLEVADLRGDAELPHPCHDPKLWTSRMQTAWDELRAIVAKTTSAREQPADPVLLTPDVAPGAERPVCPRCGEAREPGPIEDPNTEASGPAGTHASPEASTRPGRVSREAPAS